MKKTLVICLGLILIMSSFVFAGRGLNCNIDDCTSLQGHWNFDDGSGTVLADSTANDNDGSITGASWSTGKFGGALEMGTDKKIDVANDASLKPSTALTASCWVKLKSTDMDLYASYWPAACITKNSGPTGAYAFAYSLMIRDGGAPHFEIDDNGVGGHAIVGSALSVGDWHHLVGTYDGSYMRLYVNGVEYGNHSYSGTIDNSDYPLNIGYTRNYYNTESFVSFLDGYLDDVALWSRALTASEISSLYVSGVDQLSDTVVFDFSAGTTNLSTVSNILSVPSMTLAKSTGKIIWSNNVNAADQDFDTYVTIDDGFVSVDSSNLDSSLNSTATITLEDVGCGLCSDAGIFYSATATSKSEAQSGEACGTAGTCSGFSCTSNDCTFTVSSFSGYAYGGSANLTINDSAEGSYVENDTSATFYAYYINATDGSAITGATCTVDFDDGSGSQAMSFDTDHYEYTKSAGFTTAATHDWNVSCSATGYSSLFAEDTISVQAPAGSQAGVPEFSTWTLLIGLMVIIGGFFAVKRQE